MNDNYRAELARISVPFVGLLEYVDGATLGPEVSGGTYKRKAANWDIVPGANVYELVLPEGVAIDIPAGISVGGWAAFSAESGGTNYGGGLLPQESFPNGGSYVLKDDVTHIVIGASSA